MEKVLISSLLAASFMFGANEISNLETSKDCNKYLQLADDYLNKMIEKDVKVAGENVSALRATALMQRYEICLKNKNIEDTKLNQDKRETSQFNQEKARISGVMR